MGIAEGHAMVNSCLQYRYAIVVRRLIVNKITRFSYSVKYSSMHVKQKFLEFHPLYLKKNTLNKSLDIKSEA